MTDQLPNLVRVAVLLSLELRSRLLRRDKVDLGESISSLVPNYTGLRPADR